MTSMILRTAAEIFVVLALVIGFVKENKFIRTERKAIRLLRRLRRKARDARTLERAQANALYADEYALRRSSKTAAKQSSPGETKRRSARGRVA